MAICVRLAAASGRLRPVWLGKLLCPHRQPPAGRSTALAWEQVAVADLLVRLAASLNVIMHRASCNALRLSDLALHPDHFFGS